MRNSIANNTFEIEKLKREKQGILKMIEFYNMKLELQA